MVCENAEIFAKELGYDIVFRKSLIEHMKEPGMDVD